jgi:hypothetical protein
MKEKANIEFTKEEVKHLAKIINISVKQIGLEDGGETANNGIYFLNKINKAFKEEVNGSNQQ